MAGGTDSIDRFEQYLRGTVPPESSYAAFHDQQLVLLLHRHREAPALAQFVHAQLRALVLSPAFPCLGARAAVNQGSYRFGMYPELGSDAATSALGYDLRAFVAERPWLGSAFGTYMASFDGPVLRDEWDFEHLLWQQLQGLNEHDTAEWDPAVSNDPDDPRFSFSFAGCAFFLVGLHPGSSRWARRFAWPTIIFNAHDQFEALRAEGKYDRLREMIRQRDAALQGTINPMVEDFGAASEARQYSGRAVEGNWHCPFHAKRPASAVLPAP